jgi:fido (protein-threonine AMPylation protein)
VSDDVSRERRERRLVFARIRELAESPIAGCFDLAHLMAVHAYLFQDMPEHRPGVIRAETDGWQERRELEERGPSYVVPYAHRRVAARIEAVLQDIGGPEVLKGLTLDQAAARLAGLYGDLDHAHAFYEGNSRTLREFTRELALASGYRLDWTRVGSGRDARNALYIARDVAVLERGYPGLTNDRAMATDDRGEYEAWWSLVKLRELQGGNTLEHLIKGALTRSADDSAA